MFTKFGRFQVPLVAVAVGLVVVIVVELADVGSEFVELDVGVELVAFVAVDFVVELDFVAEFADVVLVVIVDALYQYPPHL